MRGYLKEARRALSMTALDLAKIVHVKEQRVYAIERGRSTPSREEGLRLADALSLLPFEAFPEIFKPGDR